MSSANLANLSPAERYAQEADKAACLLRHESKHLAGVARSQYVAGRLNKMAPVWAEAVKAKLIERAGK